MPDGTGSDLASSSTERKKDSGAFYTPDHVAAALVKWAALSQSDRMLDPACGDGRFLQLHRNSVGVEQDPAASAVALRRAPSAMVYEGNFFTWASETQEKFDCAAGNPPFIRYQRFNGEVRKSALSLCARLGVKFSALTSSWAPFLVAAASLVRPGGRMAFVVPAEIGHAPYARPLLDYLTSKFETVQLVAVRRKLFPQLSEDCWLLYAAGQGGATQSFQFSQLEEFQFSREPPKGQAFSLDEWVRWRCRLRAFLLPVAVRELYRKVADAPENPNLAEVAKVSIGYVTGANDFFHLRPSEAKRLQIPERFLQTTVRGRRQLGSSTVTPHQVKRWRDADEPMLLLCLKKDGPTPRSVLQYLDSSAGRHARRSYKCRNRDPWYVVPDVTVPDGFVSYMNGLGVSLAANRANCACTNAVHALRLRGSMSFAELQSRWSHPLTILSFEVEGHPLGGGMLKLEPREAGLITLAAPELQNADLGAIKSATELMRRWRHYG